ncbi:MAG: S41 family peptidase [Alphaproteobacteria bacterium]|nr:S41 family peptidase [Alphaproteobacteria bacterium]
MAVRLQLPKFFAGATQDAGIPVIGTRSYGKGTMQVVMPMNKDGTPARYESQVHGILRVTTDAFFPGSGPAQSLVVPPGLSLPKDFPLPKLSDVGRSNLGSGIIPNILVRTGDERDQYEDERPKEQPGLLDAGLTRAADKPVSVCTVVPELRGELSPELQAQLPKELIISFPKKDKLTGAWTRVKMLDANLACAVSLYDDTGLVDFDYYKEPASVPAQAPAVVPAPAP